MFRAAVLRKRVLLFAALGVATLLVAAGLLTRPWVGTAAPWVEAWVSSPASKVLMVRAAGQDGPAGQCGPPQVHFGLVESESVVRVEARYARILPGSGACADVGYGPTPHAVALRAPIGGRAVVDASTGEERPLLVASAEATIRDLPPGYKTYDIGHDTIDGAELVRRHWRGPGGFVLLTTQTGTTKRLLGHQEVVRYDGKSVRFHIHEDIPRDVYYLEWRMASGTQANVDLHLPHGTWAPAEALTVVRRTTDRTSSAP